MALFGRKDEDLFLLFTKCAHMVINSGNILDDLVNNYNEADYKMEILTAKERAGDRILRKLGRKLNTSFILPFDREDALRLGQTLASTIDYISGIIDIMVLYRVGEPNDTIKVMVSTLREALDIQEKAFKLLNNVELNKKQMVAYCEEISQLEHKMDMLYRQALGDLFEHEKNAISIIKWRGVYEQIEMAMDHVEDVAYLLRNIVIKYT